MLGACYLLGIDTNNPPTDHMTDKVDVEDFDNEEHFKDTIDNRDSRYAAVCTVSVWGVGVGVYVVGSVSV